MYEIELIMKFQKFKILLHSKNITPIGPKKDTESVHLQWIEIKNQIKTLKKVKVYLIECFFAVVLFWSSSPPPLSRPLIQATYRRHSFLALSLSTSG
jgi:hypothetical protein